MNLYVLAIYGIISLNLIEINGIWIKQNGEETTLNQVEETTTESTIIEEFYFECNFDTSTVEDQEFIIVGRNFVNITESHRYKPDITIDISIVMTDVTSITKETVDGEFCIIPFEFNGVQNNFCVIDEEIEENDALQCQTNAGLSNCTLGLFMKISTSPRGLSQFITTFQFNEQLTFDSEKFYEFEFSFLYSVDVCENEDLELTVFLFDLEAYEEILYRFNSNDLSIRSDSWNKVTSCFQVLSRNYQLQINASSSCTIDQNKAFFAIDNIILREMLDANQMSDCLDIRITERPLKTTGLTSLTQEITTLSTILDSEETTETLDTTELHVASTEEKTTIEFHTTVLQIITTEATTEEQTTTTTKEPTTTTEYITSTEEITILLVTTEEPNTEFHTTLPQIITTIDATTEEQTTTTTTYNELTTITNEQTTTTTTTTTYNELTTIINEQTTLEMNITITKSPDTTNNITLKIIIGVCIAVVILIAVTFVGVYLYHRKKAKLRKSQYEAENDLIMEPSGPCIIDHSS